MEMVVHPESGLSKATWTERDLDTMSFDSCQIHALAVTDDEGPPGDLTAEEFLKHDDIDDTAPSALRLHFDLDYIVRRGRAAVALAGRQVLGLTGHAGLRLRGVDIRRSALHPAAAADEEAATGGADAPPQ
ncbi:hypothetical protein [Streptomyces pseudovenezuelae]|uniref:hypothetical protein n=1 Tax=Streptomyces pseudovenezuelae TaxID=67350 RepID=UPI002E8004A4|nr:hypothetical protein [Streptomyces pseudovenezuelae]WUA93861.1 hypothetical protein OHO81_43910 [Streptomyces pseudovenezuelae]